MKKLERYHRRAEAAKTERRDKETQRTMKLARARAKPVLIELFATEAEIDDNSPRSR